MYGQVLRRMRPDQGDLVRYAVVVPESMAKAVGRVDSPVQRMLGRVASQCTVCRWIIDEMLVRGSRNSGRNSRRSSIPGTRTRRCPTRH